MQIPVYNLSGEVVEQLEVSDYVFGVPLNSAVVHQVMLSQQANARQGTASTLTRGEVSGSTRKLFAQKHTGNARAGSDLDLRHKTSPMPAKATSTNSTESDLDHMIRPKAMPKTIASRRLFGNRIKRSI